MNIEPPSTPIGRRIRQAIERSAKTPAEIARRLDCSPQAIYGWISTGRVSKENLSSLAEITGGSLHWLISGGSAPASAGKATVYLLAIHEWENPTKAMNDNFISIASGKPISADSFVLTVEGDAMSPEFPPGTMLVIDPNAAPTPGRYVVASVRGEPCGLRRLERDGAAFALIAANPAYPAITCSDSELRILGVAVLSIREL